MTEKDFLENFYKIYEKNNEKVYVSSAPHPLIMMEKQDEKKAMGMGVTPDTMMGIRFCDEKKIFIRQTDDEFVYECTHEELPKYKENNWSREIFHILAKFLKNKNTCGMQILFHCDCNDKFKNYLSAAAVGFARLFVPNMKADEILEYILPANSDFIDDFKDKISLLCPENSCIFSFDGSDVIYPFNVEGHKMIIAKTKKTMKREGEAAEEIKREFGLCAEYLKKNNLEEVGSLIKKVSAQSFKYRKNSESVAGLLNEATKTSAVCGIYEDCGIYALVRDNEVDNFVEKVGTEYEKKAGKKPEFYICASSCARMYPMN